MKMSTTIHELQSPWTPTAVALFRSDIMCLSICKRQPQWKRKTGPPGCHAFAKSQRMGSRGLSQALTAASATRFDT